ncbi:MAG: hypothetical protein IT352_01715 [Gemmatimonadales bacterium]|nr:hypothetical protein [Gemmatimonadales bacterium]
MSVLLFLAAALPVPALEGQAQIPAGSVSLAPNQRIRITVPRFGRESFESTIVAITGDTLVLRSWPAAPEVAVRRSEITAMDVVVGRGRQWRRGAEIGASVGATAGLLVGVFHGVFQDDGSFGCGDGDCTGGQLVRRGLRGAVLGGGVGLVAGLVAGGLSHGPTWRRVTGLSLAIGLSSGSTGVALVGRLERFW